MPLGIKVVLLDPLVVLLEMSAPLGGAANIVVPVVMAPVVMAPVWESMGNITALQIGLVVALGTFLEFMDLLAMGVGDVGLEIAVLRALSRSLA